MTARTARLLARRPRIALPSRPRLRTGLVVAFLLAVALLAGYMLWFRDSSLVAIEKVEVTGTDVPPGTAAELTAASTGLSTLHLDRDAVEAAVADDPAVAGLKIDTHFPHGVTIDVASPGWAEFDRIELYVNNVPEAYDHDGDVETRDRYRIVPDVVLAEDRPLIIEYVDLLYAGGDGERRRTPRREPAPSAPRGRPARELRLVSRTGKVTWTQYSASLIRECRTDNVVHQIADITADDCKAVEVAMTKCSTWLHDKAPAARAPVPGPEELGADIKALEDWVAGIRKRRKGSA